VRWDAPWRWTPHRSTRWGRDLSSLAGAWISAAGTEPDQVSASLQLDIPQRGDQRGRPAVRGLRRLATFDNDRHVLSFRFDEKTATLAAVNVRR